MSSFSSPPLVILCLLVALSPFMAEVGSMIVLLVLWIPVTLVITAIGCDD